MNTSLNDLEPNDEFIARHIGPGDDDIQHMLDTLGAESLESLAVDTLPPGIQHGQALDLAPARSEHETLSLLRERASKNTVCHNLIGLGYYETLTPTVILRNVLENPGW